MENLMYCCLLAERERKKENNLRNSFFHQKMFQDASWPYSNLYMSFPITSSCSYKSHFGLFGWFFCSQLATSELACLEYQWIKSINHVALLHHGINVLYSTKGYRCNGIFIAKVALTERSRGSAVWMRKLSCLKLSTSPTMVTPF